MFREVQPCLVLSFFNEIKRVEMVHRYLFNVGGGDGSVKREKKSTKSKGFRGPCLH